MPPVEAVFAENQALKGTVASLQEKLVALETQIAWLKRQLFAPGKGEQRDRAQLVLQLGELTAAAAAVTTQQIAYERAAARPRVPAAAAFAHLPVKETVELIPEEVKADPELYEEIGTETTFEIDLTLPRLFKREIVRRKFRHRLDRQRPPLIAPALPRVAQGGYASAGLIAYIVLAKYLHHLPLFRLEKMSARWGAQLSRQTMSDWVALAAHYLVQIYNQMKAELCAGPYLQADETPIRCQDPDHPRGQCFHGFLWVIHAPAKDVVFSWRLSRRHAEVDSLLVGFRGILGTDAYEAYAAYCRAHPEVIRVGCWAHARRGFHEALATAPVRAGFFLRLIGHLYQMERTWDELDLTPAERAHLRTRDFAPTLSLLYKAAQLCARRALPKSALGMACHYLLRQWQPLVAHCQHGVTRLDNNLIENAIRPSAIGKKNWLFIGHPDAGDRSAILYSIIVSCERRGIDPLAYLTDVLTRLPKMTTKDDLGALVPARWQPAKA